MSVDDPHTTHLALGKTLAARALGTSPGTLDKLVQGGIARIWRPDGGDRDLVVVHPTGRLDTIYREWRSANPNLTTPQDLQTFSDARNLCGIDRNEPFGPDVCKAVGELLSRVGILNEAEARAWLPTLPEPWETTRSALEPYFRSAIAARWATSSDEELEVDPELAEQALPAELRSLPRTCLDPGRAHEYEPPHRYVLNSAVRCSRHLDASILYAFITGPHSRRWLPQAHVLGYTRKFADILETVHGQSVWDPDRLDAACIWLLSDDCAKATGETGYSRLYMIRAWGWLTSALHRYSRHLSGHQREVFLQSVPSPFIQSDDLRGSMTRVANANAAERKAWRKARTRPVRENLDPILACVANRAFCARTMGDAALAAIAKLGGDTGFQDFDVLLPNLGVTGLHDGHWHVQQMRAWSWAAAWDSLGWLETSVATREAIRRQRARGTDDGPIIEVLGRHPLTDAEPVECWLLECARNFTQASIASLPVEAKLARIETLVKYGLPTVRETHSGLLKFTDTRASLARNASLYGRVFVPLLEMCHAIRLAALEVSVGEQTSARRGEVTQIRIDRWQRDDVFANSAHYSQEVIPKVPSHSALEDVEPIKLTVRRSTIDEMLDLHDLELVRTGETAFPTVPLPSRASWKAEPGPLIFSHQGRPIPDLFASTCLAYVLAGRRRFTIHDLRHALNEEAEQEGVPDWIRAARLGHSGLFALHNYDAADGEFDDEAEERGIERRSRRLDTAA